MKIRMRGPCKPVTAPLKKPGFAAALTPLCLLKIQFQNSSDRRQVLSAAAVEDLAEQMNANQQDAARSRNYSPQLHRPIP